MEGLVYRSSYLPPNNSDFGKKKVYFEVEGNKVDYADIEVFYPADAINHPPGGPKGWKIQDPAMRCELVPGDEKAATYWSDRGLESDRLQAFGKQD
jgi:hypothetical protein